MRRLTTLSMFVVLFVSAFVLAPQTTSVQAASVPAAASISAGCAYVNALGSAAVGRFINFSTPLVFRKGDVITVKQQGSDWLLILDSGSGFARALDKSFSIQQW